MTVDRVRMSDVQKAYDFCFNHAEEMLPRMKQHVFEHGETGDRITPFERGKEWTFEFLSQYQPKTSRQPQLATPRSNRYSAPHASSSRHLRHPRLRQAPD